MVGSSPLGEEKELLHDSQEAHSDDTFPAKHSGTSVMQALQSRPFSDQDMQRLVDEKLEYLTWLLAYAKERGITLRPRTENMPATFACGLGEEIEEYALKYMKGQISLDDIPDEVFRPKYIYYDLHMLLEQGKDILREIFAHEMGHAEVSDYKDILYVAKWSYDNMYPSKRIAGFFNGANEDPFIGRYLSEKSVVRRDGVRELYTKVAAVKTQGEVDVRMLYKIEQFDTKVAYHWLNTDFPETYNMHVIVDDDVEAAYQEIVPLFDAVTSPDAQDSHQRVVRKNELYLPILARLAQEDVKKQALQNKIQDLLQQGQGQPQQQGQGQPQQQGQGQPQLQSGGDGDAVDFSHLSSDEREKYMAEAEKAFDALSDEEKEDLLKKAAHHIDQEDIALPDENDQGKGESNGEGDEKKTKPELASDKAKKKRASPLPREMGEDENGQLQVKATQKQHAVDTQKSKDLQKQVEEKIAIKEKSIEEAAKIKKDAQAITSIKDKKGLRGIKNKAKTIQDSTEKSRILDVIQKREEQLQREREQFLQVMQEEGFSEDEEEYYEEYLRLENEIEPVVEDFIKALEDFLPKLQEYVAKGAYHSGMVYDIPLAARKLRLNHYDFYGRQEVKESVKVNLGVLLSVDVSVSMENQMKEVRKLAIFLGLVCQKLNIPFYVNAFGSTVKTVKYVHDAYTSQKGELYRMTTKLQGSTYLEGALIDLLDQVGEQKMYNHDVSFLPMIITDGDPTTGEQNSEKLAALSNKFGGLDIVFGLNMSESEKTTCEANFPQGEKIWLDGEAVSSILTIGQSRLIEFLVDNKDKLFTYED